MKLKNKIYTVAAAAVLMCSSSSCLDYLDVSKELSHDMDKEEVFSKWKYMKEWYGAMYANMPRLEECGYDLRYPEKFYNAWTIFSGEVVCAHPTILAYAQNAFTPSSSTFHRWADCYKTIRQGMIFLEMAPESLGRPGEAAYQSPEMIRRMKADVIYLIAYNYFQLFELYGPAPIVSELSDPNNAHLDYERASVDEMLEYIDGLLEQVITGEYADVMPDVLAKDDKGAYSDLSEILRPTKAAALALRARLWVYAASPLFNGGYEESLSVVNKDGKRLFPDKDDSKWRTAKTRLEVTSNAVFLALFRAQNLFCISKLHFLVPYQIFYARQKRDKTTGK